MTVSLVQNTDGTITVSNGSGPTVTISVNTLSSVIESLIRAQSLNQLAAPTAALNMNGQSFINAADIGRLLGATYYEPTGSLYSKTTDSNTGSAVDTTNLTVSFTATTSAVVVELTAPAAIYAGSGGYYWGLQNHASPHSQVGYWVIAINGNAGNLYPTTVKIRVTGLTAGTSYQYDWAHVVSGSTLPYGILAAECATGNPASGSDYGPAIMRVLAA